MQIITARYNHTVHQSLTIALQRARCIPHTGERLYLKTGANTFRFEVTAIHRHLTIEGDEEVIVFTDDISK